MKTLSKFSQFNFLTVNFKQKTKIPTHDIIMMEGHNNYTLFYLENGKQKMYARTLGHFEEQLSNDSFIRCHRAFLVNSDFITGYNKVENKFFMQNNLEATISRRKQAYITDFLIKIGLLYL